MQIWGVVNTNLRSRKDNFDVVWPIVEMGYEGLSFLLSPL